MTAGDYRFWYPLVIVGLLAGALTEIRLSKRAVGRQYVQFAGQPRFEVLENQSVGYALNSSSTVLRIGLEYYLFRDGVWFKSTSPAGPYYIPDGLPMEIATAALSP